MTRLSQRGGLFGIVARGVIASLTDAKVGSRLLPDFSPQRNQSSSVRHPGGLPSRNMAKPALKSAKLPVWTVLRFISALPFLVTGIGLVLAGRLLMDREDRIGFDANYFGPAGRAPSSGSCRPCVPSAPPAEAGRNHPDGTRPARSLEA